MSKKIGRPKLIFKNEEEKIEHQRAINRKKYLKYRAKNLEKLREKKKMYMRRQRQKLKEIITKSITKSIIV